MTSCPSGARAATVVDNELADWGPDLPPAGLRTGRSARLFVWVFTEPVGVPVRELGPRPIGPRDQPVGLRRTPGSLLHQEHVPGRFLVVNNAPGDLCGE
jgi:hypothetical protein